MDSSAALNDHGCFLLSNGCIPQGLTFLKQALTTLRHELQDEPEQVAVCNVHLPQHKLVGTPIAATDFLPSTISCFHVQQERFWIYSRPLLVGECPERTSASDTFTVSFNVALGAHLHGTQYSIAGDMDEAYQSFVVALKMYNLTLQQATCSAEECGPCLNNRKDLIFAAIFNNLAHVYAALGQNDYAKAAAEQLMRALFFLVDSGRLSSLQEMQAHDSLLKNACLLTMKTQVTATAA